MPPNELELALTESRTLRQQHATRTDVLDKVKALLLLPDGVHATVEMVAEYFEVSVDTIKSAVKDHRAELEANGYRVLKGADLRRFVRSHKDLANLIDPMTRQLALFDRRAILNVGQLLREAEVARQVRTALLDVEESAAHRQLAPPAQPSALLPDMTTPEGRLAVGEMLVAGAQREIAVGIERDEARAALAVAQPRAEYVDGFVDPEEDASILRVFAGQVGTTDPKLRAYLKEHKVLSRRTVENRWSSSKGRMEPVYEWLALAGYVKWFVPKDQPEAPRLHNGQMRTTLYVTPVGKVGIRRLLMKHPIDGETASVKVTADGWSA
jgi:phage antirepressor YoqD-like protein